MPLSPAIHIEMAHSNSLDMNSMINALRRFIRIRGCPEQIRSDRGTNFTGADKELKEAIEGWNQQKVNSFCAHKKIAWIFNPPAASHKGGAWERMKRSVQRIVRAMLKEKMVMTDEVLSASLGSQPGSDG